LESLVTVAKSIALFALPALFEVGGAWLARQEVREHRGSSRSGETACGFTALSVNPWSSV
jgi:drug/metabolite transporter superfamily protein YnfA